MHSEALLLFPDEGFLISNASDKLSLTLTAFANQADEVVAIQDLSAFIICVHSH